MNWWSPKEDAFLAEKAAEGWTARRIAEEVGRSRNSVIGRSHRLGVKIGSVQRRSVATKRRTDANVIKLVIPKHRPNSPLVATPMRTVEVERGPRLSVISNERKLIEDFIARHGVRRFDSGQRSDYHAIKAFLQDRGYSISGGWQGKQRVSSGHGRSRSMLWHEVISLVDKLRAEEGLQTLRRPA